MAYMGRGRMPSIGGNNTGSKTDVSNDNLNNRNNGRRYYRGYFFRRYYYIPLDNTYVIMQMIATFIILIVAGIAFLTTYKSPINDPIQDTKNIIMNTHIIITLSLLVITLLANYFSKNKKTLIRILIMNLILSIITIFVFVGIKMNMDATYTSSKFEQIYEEYEEQNSNGTLRIDIDYTGMKIKNEKEYYIDECLKLYNIFNIKTYGILGLDLLLIILLIYQISKVSKIQEKKDRLTRDDAILFDEEENVKI